MYGPIARLMLVSITAYLFLACSGPHGRLPMPVDSCSDAVSKFLSKDLTRWTGLPATCTLAGLSGLEVGNEETHAVLGEDAVPAVYRRARAASYSETITIWLRDDKIVGMSVRLPELPDPPGLLRALGAPDAKLDAWSAITPTLVHEAEWVYPQRGLALVLSSDKRNVMELVLYVPSSVEQYRKTLRFWEPVREHLE
jgi:hypothetical protein